MPGADNIKGYEFGGPKRSANEVREAQAKGGRKSGETRRRKRDAQKVANYIATLPAQMHSDVIEHLRNQEGLSEDDPCILHAIAYSMALSAIEGDSRAARVFLEMCGQDAATRIAKERLKFEREKLKQEKGAANDTERPIIIDDIGEKP